MLVFLDCEFNGFGRELISLALVTEGGQEWYEVLPHPDHGWDKWVYENVYPVLNRDPVPRDVFVNSLMHFLQNHCDGATFIADWPADFGYFSELLAEMGKNLGFRTPIVCKMELIVSGRLLPVMPHNALSDARALRSWYMDALKGQI